MRNNNTVSLSTILVRGAELLLWRLLAWLNQAFHLDSHPCQKPTAMNEDEQKSECMKRAEESYV